MTRLRDRPADLAALVSDASARLGLPLVDVEKDFWVVELLRSIARPIPDGQLIFKGGTSLSKAYKIIERFSEDADVLVVPTQGLGGGKRDRLLKSVAARAAEDLGLDGRLITSTTGVKRNVSHDYPAAYADPERLTAGVLLEMGIRGGPEPHEPRDVRSYVALSAVAAGVPADEFDEFTALSVLTLKPERTLVEKLALLHDRASRLSEQPAGLSGQGRHIYDIYRLLRTPSVRLAISDPGAVATLAADAEAHSRRYGFPSTPRPEAGFAHSPAWTPPGNMRRTMEDVYSATAGLVWGTVPSFDECVSQVAEASAYL